MTPHATSLYVAAIFVSAVILAVAALVNFGTIMRWMG